MEPIKEVEAKPRKENPWLQHVKDVRSKHPDKTYKEVLQIAKETYTKVEKQIKQKKEKAPVNE